MRKLLNRIFGEKTKDGRFCRWWNHDFGYAKEEFIMIGTGKFINDAEIKQKRRVTYAECKKCPMRTYHT